MFVLFIPILLNLPKLYFWARPGLTDPKMVEITHTYLTVSYTHLDVYKRQVFNMRYEQPSAGEPVIVNGTAYSDQEKLGNALKEQYKVRSVMDITSCNTCHR